MIQEQIWQMLTGLHLCEYDVFFLPKLYVSLAFVHVQCRDVAMCEWRYQISFSGYPL